MSANLLAKTDEVLTVLPNVMRSSGLPAETAPRTDGTMPPRISVIMPAYNVAPYIGAAVSSVLAQTYTDFELIVVNDGSPDTPALEEVLSPYFDRIIYLKQENRGLSGARNTGLRSARGEFVALLDSDDVWETDYLAVQLAALESDPTLDAVYPNAIFFGDTVLAGRRYMDEHPSRGPVTFASLCRADCTVMVSVMARREIIFRAGLFDESLPINEDFDMWLRVLKSGGRIGYHAKPLVHYRRRDDSLSAHPARLCGGKLQYLAKVERTMQLTPEEQLALAQMRAQAQAYIDWYDGKKAFFAGDLTKAHTLLTTANNHFRSRKLRVTLALMKIAPSLLRGVYAWRDRYFYRTDTRPKL